MKNLTLILIIAVRLLANFLLFIFNVPLVFALIYTLDSIDGPIYKHYLKLNPLKAQYIDKILDLIYYIFLIIQVYRDNLIVKELLLILFLYRLIGQVVFFITKNKHYLVYFINFFEFYTIVFYLLIMINPDLVTSNLNIIVPIFTVLSIYRFNIEIFLHTKQATFFDNFIVPLFKKKT